MKKILAGILIIQKYSTDNDFEADHDQVWCGDSKASEMEMTEDELKQLDELGWWIDEEHNTWSHFC